MKTETLKPVWNSPIFSKFNHFILLSVLLLVIAFQSILGQNLDEFKRCSGENGVESIPYSDLKAKAKSAEEAKVRANQEAEEYSIKNFEGAKKELLGHFVRAKKRVLADEEHLAVEKKVENSLKLSEFETYLSESQSILKDLEYQLVKINEKITEAVRRYKVLLAARVAVREAFTEVDKELDYSLNRPEEHIGQAPSSSDTDDDRRYYETKLSAFKGYISTIGSKMDTAAEGHQTQIDNVTNAITNLENLLALTSNY